MKIDRITSRTTRLAEGPCKNAFTVPSSGERYLRFSTSKQRTAFQVTLTWEEVVQAIMSLPGMVVCDNLGDDTSSTATDRPEGIELLLRACDTIAVAMGARDLHAVPNLRGSVQDYMRSSVLGCFKPTEYDSTPHSLPEGDDNEAED